MRGFETLSRILTSMLSPMTWLREAIHTFISEERKPYHNYSMSPVPQKLIANYSIRGLTVPRAGDRSLVLVSIHGGSRSHMTYTVAHPEFGKGGPQLGIWGRSPQSPTNFCSFLIKTFILAHVFIA